jgi:hypothetical protein
LKHQFQRPLAPQVLRAFAAPLVLCEAPRNVNSNTGVEAAIATLDEVYAVRGNISHASLARLMPGVLRARQADERVLFQNCPAVRALPVVNVIRTISAKGALEGANHCVQRICRKVTITMLAIRPQLKH